VASGRAWLAASGHPLLATFSWDRAYRGFPGVAHGVKWCAPMSHDARLEALVAAVARRWALTPRQSATLALLARGEANKDIAAKLRCSVKTVEAHVTAILAKVGADSRAQLVARVWMAEPDEAPRRRPSS
jgi:DNA-binding CsgD family transcriptional regulator